MREGKPALPERATRGPGQGDTLRAWRVLGRMLLRQVCMELVCHGPQDLRCWGLTPGQGSGSSVWIPEQDLMLPALFKMWAVLPPTDLLRDDKTASPARKEGGRLQRSSGAWAFCIETML